MTSVLNMRAPLYFSLTVILAVIPPLHCVRTTKPHIVFITADDLGWNDVGWHNKYIMTPHLDYLARNGVILNQSYVLPTCTPSRSSLLTGYYAFRLGRQEEPLKRLANTGLSIKFTLLPQVLKDLGYKSHIVGKWHLGYCNESYTPTFRGFETFFGGYIGYRDHFTHSYPAIPGDAKVNIGLDFWNNTTPVRNYCGVYSANAWAKGAIDILQKSDPNDPLFLFLNFHTPHSPLQAPERYIAMYSDVKDESRRNYSAMVTAMDVEIGRVVKAMKQYGFLENSIIIFTTDNGALYSSGGSNWPLKGGKFSVWEGGTRATGFIYGNKLKKKGYVNNKLIHITDWFPTLIHLAGGSVDGVDGVNQWDVISYDAPAVRDEMVYNIFEDGPNRAALRVGKYKLVYERTGEQDACWTPPRSPGSTTDQDCEDVPSSQLEYRLYNLDDDPEERNNLANKYPTIVARMKERLANYTQEMVPADIGEEFLCGHPFFYGGVYTPGWCVAK